MDPGADGGAKVAAKRQCREGRLCGTRIRLYRPLLNGRCGLRIGRKVERASDWG